MTPENSGEVDHKAAIRRAIIRMALGTAAVAIVLIAVAGTIGLVGDEAWHTVLGKWAASPVWTALGFTGEVLSLGLGVCVLIGYAATQLLKAKCFREALVYNVGVPAETKTQDSTMTMNSEIHPEGLDP